MPYSTPDRGLSKDLWPEISLRPLRSPTDSLRKIWGGISSSETSLEAPWEVPSGKLRTRESGNSLKSFSSSSEPERKRSPNLAGLRGSLLGFGGETDHNERHRKW